MLEMYLISSNRLGYSDTVEGGASMTLGAVNTVNLIRK